MKNIIALCALFFAVTAFAANYTDLAVEAGIRNQNGDVDGGDTNAKIGYQLGLSAAFPIADKLSFRSGLFYSEKDFELKATSTTASQNIKFSYVEIPATFELKFLDYAGVYAGVNLSMNLDNDCGSNSCHNVQSFVTPIVIGAAFKFAPQLGADVFFEDQSGKVADGIKNLKAVGVNLMITFD
jgi:hypothetical protein